MSTKNANPFFKKVFCIKQGFYPFVLEMGLKWGFSGFNFSKKNEKSATSFSNEITLKSSEIEYRLLRKVNDTNVLEKKSSPLKNHTYTHNVCVPRTENQWQSKNALKQITNGSSLNIFEMSN